MDDRLGEAGGRRCGCPRSHSAIRSLRSMPGDSGVRRVKAVLLAGGLGTRMREETEFRPKPMVEIGGQPILWHIMRNLAHFGVTDFVIASGYKSEVIDDYFLDHPHWTRVPVASGRTRWPSVGTGDEADWRVTVAFTGDVTRPEVESPGSPRYWGMRRSS